MRDKIDRLLKNYSNARQSWDSWFYMYTTGPFNFTTGQPDYDGSPKQKVDDNILLTYLRSLAFKDYHIEISKIIKDTPGTEDNIFDILKLYLVQRPDLKDEIDIHLKALNDLKPEIKKITKRRDKIFAHLDSDYMNYGGQGGLEPFDNIFKAVENSIILLTSKAEFQELCDKIPSHFYHLEIK